MNRTSLDRLLDWWQVDDQDKRNTRRLSVALAIVVAVMIATGTALDDPAIMLR